MARRGRDKEEAKKRTGDAAPVDKSPTARDEKAGWLQASVVPLILVLASVALRLDWSGTPARVAVEDLPNLTEPYAVASHQVEAFREKGWVKAPGLLSTAEARAWRPYVEDVLRSRWAEKKHPVDKTFWRVDNSWLVDEVVARLILAPRIAKLAGDLMGCPVTRLYKDSIFFKNRSHQESPWHQDHIATPLEAEGRVVNCWVALDDVSGDMAPLLFASGSQVERLPLQSKAASSLYREALARHRNWTTAGDLRAGDATCHASWTLHAAEANTGRRVRKAISMMYLCNGTAVADHDSLASRSMDDLGAWKRWFETGGLHYGKPILSPLCPQAYPQSDEWLRAKDLPTVQKWDI